MEKTSSDVYINGLENGPVVIYAHPRGDVKIEWKNPPDDYTKHRKVVPLVVDWDEYDAVSYLLGKSILDHFTGRKK